MTAISRNLQTLKTKYDTTQSAIAAVAGATDGAVSKWFSGEKTPRNKYLEKIASYYGVSMDDLTSEKSGLYAQAHSFDKPDIPGGALAPADPTPAHAPLYGRVHAGNADEPTILDDSIPIPHEVWEHHKSGYFLEVEGTCMNRVYPEGCYVFIDPDMTPQNGSIAVVSIDTEDYIMRRLHRGKSAMILSPESFDDSWDDIVITNREVQLVGTVVWYQSREEME